MKLYLSSYKIGDEGQKLARMVSGEKRIALISNALDCYSDLERRKKSEQDEIEALIQLGLKPDLMDLREYFGKQEELREKLNNFNAVWVRGGNVFVLRVAMNKSGFDEIFKDKAKDKDFVYAGYSAGPCLLSKSLKGFEIVDSTDALQDAYPGEDLIWDGLGLINFVFVPHYKSDHPESPLIEKEVEYLKKHNIKFKTFSDGEVYISEI